MLKFKASLLGLAVLAPALLGSMPSLAQAGNRIDCEAYREEIRKDLFRQVSDEVNGRTDQLLTLAYLQQGIFPWNLQFSHRLELRKVGPEIPGYGLSIDMKFVTEVSGVSVPISTYSEVDYMETVEGSSDYQKDSLGRESLTPEKTCRLVWTAYRFVDPIGVINQDSGRPVGTIELAKTRKSEIRVSRKK